MKKFILFWPAFLLAVCLSAGSRPKPKPLHFGIFVHYLYNLQNTKLPWNQGKVTSWDQCVNDLDVDKLASELAEIHADYLIITTGQNQKYLCFPDSTYEAITGYPRGQATSHRDLISDLYTALNKRGIKLFLYSTGDGPSGDAQASKALNNPTSRMKPGSNFKTDEPWVKSWAVIIKSISMQYKDKITGWWFDGCYGFIDYNDALLENFQTAAKAGNKNALVAFNFLGPQDVISIGTIGNYTAGESDKFASPPDIKLTDKKVKWHLLSYLGTYWARPGARYSADYMSSYIDKVAANNGMVTLDVCLLRDGSIDSAQYSFLKKIRNPAVN